MLCNICVTYVNNILVCVELLSWHTRSLSSKMLTFRNFKETYGKLNYEILLLTTLQILQKRRKVYIFFFCVAVSLMVLV